MLVAWRGREAPPAHSGAARFRVELEPLIAFAARLVAITIQAGSIFIIIIGGVDDLFADTVMLFGGNSDQ